jgi:NodT family efflux transporter outer membrane factor (OMF) lipoprotein
MVQPVPPPAVADGKAQRLVQNEDVVQDWWRLLGSPAVDSTVARALAFNPGLESARANLRRSQDELRAGYGVFFPQVDGRAGFTRERASAAPGILPSNTFNLFSLSGTVSYALDLWGGARRGAEALQAEVDGERYALAGAYVMLASNVVDAIVAQAAYRAEIVATQSTLDVLRQQVRIAETQATAGTNPLSTALTLRSQAASTEAALPVLEEKIDQTADLLAVLTGSSPADWTQSPVDIAELHLPADLPLSLPSRLVRQRPDVLAAEAQLHVANANIGVATAAMLPNVTLGAGYGVNNPKLADLFSPASVAWNLAAGLTQPLFHGGTLYYERKAAIDARDAAAAQYRQTVLASFQQVADTLRGLEHDADAVKADVDAVDAAERAMHLVDANYQAGIATYVQVLIADQQYLQSKVTYVQGTAQRLQDTVALYAALGGGWWHVSSLDD